MAMLEEVEVCGRFCCIDCMLKLVGAIVLACCLRNSVAICSPSEDEGRREEEAAGRSDDVGTCSGNLPLLGATLWLDVPNVFASPTRAFCWPHCPSTTPFIFKTEKLSIRWLWNLKNMIHWELGGKRKKNKTGDPSVVINWLIREDRLERWRNADTKQSPYQMSSLPGGSSRISCHVTVVFTSIWVFPEE